MYVELSAVYVWMLEADNISRVKGPEGSSLESFFSYFDTMVTDADESINEPSPPVGGGRSETDLIESAKATRGSTVDKLEGSEYEALLGNSVGFDHSGGSGNVAYFTHPTIGRTRESLGNLFFCAFIASITTLFLVLASARGWQWLRNRTRTRKHKKTGDISVDEQSLKAFKKDMKAAFEEFSKEWEEASPSTKLNFRRDFFPSGLLGEGVDVDPAKVLGDRVSDLRYIVRPSLDDRYEVRRHYALRARLYSAVIKAATSRLKSYEEKSSFTIQHPTLSLPSKSLRIMWGGEGSADLSEQATFEDFNQMLGERKVELSKVRVSHGAKAPRIFATKLASMVLFGGLEASADRKAHASFRVFVEALGGAQPQDDLMRRDSWDNFPLLPSNRNFFAAFFRDAFHRMEELVMLKNLQEVPVTSWAEQWDGESLLKTIRELECQREDWNRKKKELRDSIAQTWKNMQSEHPGLTDIITIALYLL